MIFFSALVATTIKSEIPAKCFSQYCKTPRVYSSLHIGEIHSYEFMNWYYVQYSQNGDRGVFNITQRPQLSTSTSQPSIELHQPRTASPASQEEPSTAAGESKKERGRLPAVRFPLQILAGIMKRDALA